MGTNAGKMDSLFSQINETRKTYFEELDHIVDNGRWLSSLVLAEIAGIAAYRGLIKKESLSVPFAFIVVFLALTILFFMVSALFARNSKLKITALIQPTLDDANVIDKNGKIADDDGDILINEISTHLNKKISDTPYWTRIFETIGIVLFILTSFLTTVFVFLSEIQKIFN
jgi:uncharacterized protein YacL